MEVQMRFPITAAIGLASLVFASPPAFAQEEPTFTGIRVGGIFGWDNFSAGDRESDSKDDVIYGGDIGYDYQMGNFVLGIEGEIAGTGVAATAIDVDVLGDEFKIEAGRDLYIGARVGYVVMPQLMIYAKGGYTNMDFNAIYDPTRGITGPVTEIDDKQDGYRFGAGVEYLFGGGFYAKAEYRYSHYGENLLDYDVDMDRSQIIVGAGFRF
jgi:outer membrane immunogenic protein